MEKDKLILKDKTKIELETGASLDNIGVIFDSRGKMLAAWERMSQENLSEVRIESGAGITIGRYSDLVLVSETSTMDAEGKVHTSFRLREKSELEKKINKMEDTQGMVLGAIDDLGVVTSALAEAQETQEGGATVG